ncbi:MAG: hypothetical protein JW995_02790 [Melioribacteraceae bacterium]|nr:hypothetical protein [Melioribacteraceae bacterium]
MAVALAVGINLFRASAVDQKRNALINDCVHLSAIAQQYYLKPVEYGGGGMDYSGWVIPDELVANGNGNFRITNQSATQIVILATGNEVVTGNDSVKVEIIIPSPPQNYQVTPLN